MTEIFICPVIHFLIQENLEEIRLIQDRKYIFIWVNFLDVTSQTFTRIFSLFSCQNLQLQIYSTPIFVLFFHSNAFTP